jgi:hypothetical protein
MFVTVFTADRKHNPHKYFTHPLSFCGIFSSISVRQFDCATFFPLLGQKLCVCDEQFSFVITKIVSGQAKIA